MVGREGFFFVPDKRARSSEGGGGMRLLFYGLLADGLSRWQAPKNREKGKGEKTNQGAAQVPDVDRCRATLSAISTK